MPLWYAQKWTLAEKSARYIPKGGHRLLWLLHQLRRSRSRVFLNNSTALTTVASRLFF